MLKYIFFLLLVFFVAACTGDEQSVNPSTSVSTGTPVTELTAEQRGIRQSADFKMIFFLNPNGAPCQQQISILNDMANELGGKVDVQYVQTTVPADLNIFHDYGIRALPTLLLAQADGKELKRMSPGVKQADDIRHFIQPIL